MESTSSSRPQSSHALSASQELNGFKEQPAMSSGNKFQQAIAAWRSTQPNEIGLSLANNLTDIDLTSLITTLDNTASDIVTYQRDSTVQRKDLAQKTKDFRKLDDSAKLVEYKGLLKGRACLQGSFTIS
jgi:homeobox protein cut-like